ncbi:MAG: hypothetical protein U0791_10150 [Gemmataceae bacterium]
MAKPVSFKSKPKQAKSTATDFNFGANVPTFTAKVRARGASKKAGSRQSRSAGGGS